MVATRALRRSLDEACGTGVPLRVRYCFTVRSGCALMAAGIILPLSECGARVDLLLTGHRFEYVALSTTGDGRARSPDDVEVAVLT